MGYPTLFMRLSAATPETPLRCSSFVSRDAYLANRLPGGVANTVMNNVS